MVLIALMTATCLALPVSTASASCAEDSGPSGSAVQFVGTVLDERAGHTRFGVFEVWTDPDLAREVWVRTELEPPAWPWSLVSGHSSSVDADLAEGATYAVGASADFVSSACTIVEADAVADEDRPESSRPPTDDGLTGSDPPLAPATITALVIGAAATALLIGLWLRRRQRRTTAA